MKARSCHAIWLSMAVATMWLPQAGFACAVCFGDPQSHATKGMNLAILTLLGITLGMLGGIAAFMVYLARKSAAVARAQAALELSLEEEEPVNAASDFRNRPAGHATLSHHTSHSRRSHDGGHHRSLSPRRRLNFPD